MMQIVLLILILKLIYGRIGGNYIKFGYSNSAFPDWHRSYQNWPIYSAERLPGKSKSLEVYYYQTLVDLQSTADILYYRISLVFDSGFIMFLNGNEIYRQLLPNNASNKTEPNRNDLLFQQTIRFLPYYFIDGLNLISFEFHSKRESLSDPFEMTIDVERSSDNCSSNLNAPQMYGHSVVDTHTEKFKFAYDGNHQTKYLGKANSIRHTMFLSEPSGFNKFVLYTANDCCSRDPGNFTLEGISKPLSSFVPSTFSDPLYLKNITYTGEFPECKNPNSNNGDPESRNRSYPFELDNKRAYNGYSFNVLNPRSLTSSGCSNGNMQFAELELYSCKIGKCKSTDDLPDAFIGTEIARPCKYGTETIKYICSDNGDWNLECDCPSNFVH